MSAFNPNLLLPPASEQSIEFDYMNEPYWDFLEVVMTEPNGGGRRKAYVYDSRNDEYTRVYSDGRLGDTEGQPDGVDKPEGPQMNFFWPLDDDLYDELGTAAAIGFGNCALVRLHDLSDYLSDDDPRLASNRPEQWGIALTGGGMDLSWSIASAFVEAGYYPPSELSINQGGPADTWQFGVGQIGAPAARKVKRALTVRLKNQLLALRYNLKAVEAWK